MHYQPKQNYYTNTKHVVTTYVLILLLCVPIISKVCSTVCDVPRK